MLKKICLAIFISVSLSFVFGQKDLAQVKAQMIKETLNKDLNDSFTKVAMSTMKEDGSWSAIDYIDVSHTGFEHHLHIENLLGMSLSYSKKNSKFYRNRKLKKDINTSLKFWVKNDFVAANWWYNLVFLPRSFIDICLVMEKDINKDVFDKMKEIISRSNMDSPWARPSADRARIADVVGRYQILFGNEKEFEKIAPIIKSELKLSTGKRGLQIDNSFHHRVHRENNTVEYGTAYADTFVRWIAYLVNTKYTFSGEKIKLIVDFYLDGITKHAAFGKLSEPGSANRELSRKKETLVFSSKMLETIKKITNYRKSEIQEIIDLRKGKLYNTSLSFAKFYWQSEFFVFQRPNFYTSVRMFSIRNRNVELAHNNEGIMHHHKGDGANHLTVDGSEYFNIWPVYDWQKIPGTTVLQKPKMPSVNRLQKDGFTDFVGATTDGMYGTVGFNFISPHDGIRAKKSWFFFDEEYVCLGAGIASNNFSNSVNTTINQSFLNGNVVISNQKGEKIIEKGVHKLDSINWVHHNGIGYIFPEPTKISINNQMQRGKWSDINKQASSSTELVEKEVFKIWFDHGKRPQGENLWLYPGKMGAIEVGYQYIVVPNVVASSLQQHKNNITVLSNNSQIQAVKHEKLGITQIVFYKAAKVEIDTGITVELDSPGILILKSKNGKVEEISASDPSRKIGKLHITISGQDSISIELPKNDFAGDSVTVKI